MAITPIPGVSGPEAAGPLSPGTPPGTGLDNPKSKIQNPKSEEASKPKAAEELSKLKEVASQSGLEVKFETLPDTNVTVLRLLDARTGSVVGEFPPRGVAMALASLQARMSAHGGRVSGGSGGAGPRRSALDRRA